MGALAIAIPVGSLPAWAVATVDVGMDLGELSRVYEHRGELVDVKHADGSLQLAQRLNYGLEEVTAEAIRIDLLTDADITSLTVQGARSLARALTIMAGELEKIEMHAVTDHEGRG